MEKQLVSVSWLKENINNPNMVVLDASIPVVTENSKTAKETNITGARFMDLKNIFSDVEANLPNTMPSPKQFEVACRNLGINENSIIITYDTKGIYSSPRAWFLFKTMGHAAIAVLDGGLPEWMKDGGSCSLAYAQNYPLGNFKSNFDPKRLKNASSILDNIRSGKYLVIDARSEDRFLGKVPEPRTHLKRGHIPKSINLPFSKLIKDGKFLTQQELKTTFKDAFVGDYPLLFSCGSGITACILLFAANLVLENELFLYDGSWSEWGEGDEYPVK